MSNHEVDFEGYYLWFLANSTSDQAKAFAFALGRIARKHPSANPREAILEFFAESIYAYEQHIKELKRGKGQQQESLRRIERVLTERADRLRASNSKEEAGETPQQASKRKASYGVTSESDRRIKVSSKLWD